MIFRYHFRPLDALLCIMNEMSAKDDSPKWARELAAAVKLHLEESAEDRRRSDARYEEHCRRFEEFMRRAEEDRRKAEEDRKTAEEDRKTAEEDRKTAAEDRKTAEEDRKEWREQQRSERKNFSMAMTRVLLMGNRIGDLLAQILQTLRVQGNGRPHAS